MNKILMVFLASVLVAAAHTPASAGGRKVKQVLVTTGADPDAGGKASLALKQASTGQFEIQVRKLARKATFQVIVEGVHVGDLVTNGGGGGKLRFRSRPRGNDLSLGFDPRGRSIVVRDADGNDVLVGDFPVTPPGAPASIVCCIPDDQGPECEDRTADECAAQGGTVADATSCLPNPCVGAPPVGSDIVCCIPGDEGPECEDRSQAECMAQGGTVVQATSCAPNPCAPTPPAGGEVVCCVPDQGGDGPAECEDRTAAACTAAGGTVSDATSCAPDPCNAVPPPITEIACCVPDDSGPDCEDRTPDACAAEGGTPAATGTCVPDPCAAVASQVPYYGAGGDDGGRHAADDGGHGGGSGGGPGRSGHDG
jgi:hypothetical protein